jgi:FkbM family methyltransferase
MLKANDALRLCADAHEEEVITKDSYGLRALLERDKEIKYIVDIGANIGAFSVFAQRLFSPDVVIIACEPEPSMMKYVKENTDNKLIYVEKAIVGDSSLKEVKFNICKWQGNHHVDGVFNKEVYCQPEVGSEILSSIIVPAITLNKVCFDYSLRRIDLLKIDTEGAEPQILESLGNMVQDIRHIFIEWHSQKDLERIKKSLEKTHDCTFVDGYFKEKDGTPANGNIVAELKK